MSAMTLMLLMTVTMFLPMIEGSDAPEDDVEPEVDPTPAPGVGDIFDGTDGADTLSVQGSDTLNGGAGDDVLGVAADANGAAANGDAGNDTLTGGGVQATLSGGEGDDVLSDDRAQQNELNGGDGADTLTLTGTGGVANGDTGQDTLTIAGGNTGNGGEGDDTITASGGDDGTIAVVTGGRGDDVLIEGVSDSGGALNFEANGGAGNDTIQVRLGLSDQVGDVHDTLTGGTRGDTFMLDLLSGEGDGTDLITGVEITDFNPTEDTLIIDTANIDGQDTVPPALTFGDFTLSEAGDASYTDVLIEATQLAGGAQSIVTVRLFGVSGIEAADISLAT